MDTATPHRPLPVRPDDPTSKRRTTYIDVRHLPPPRKSIDVVVNCFRVHAPSSEYFRYTMSAIESTRAKKPQKTLPKWLVRRSFGIMCRQIFVVFDGGVALYTHAQIPGWNESPSVEVDVPRQGPSRRGGRFAVIIKFDSVVQAATLQEYVNPNGADVDMRPALQALDIVLRNANRRFINYGSVAYNPRLRDKVPNDATKELLQVCTKAFV